ncbi:hypothetical protein GALL_465480 [mine drainage metagenome]|uniref:Uncharacterized protein n=1 Tax=mine drainage metagenome TaxID=410659 RepID=A0A1J5PJT8_9ZZZZ
MGLVKRAAIGKSDIAQGLEQNLLVKFLDSDKFDIGNGRAFFYHHDQHIPADINAHVLEQAKRKQGPNGSAALVVVINVTDLDR